MNFPLSLYAYLLSFIILTCGAIIQGSIGFGLGLLAVPLLILIDPAFVPGPLLLIAFFLNIMISYRERKGADYPSLKWLITGRLLGTIVAAGILRFLPDNILGILFGSLILMAVAMSSSGIHLRIIPANLFSVGSLSGFMATSVGVGGPPLALLYQKQSGNKIRGTLAAVFLIGTLMSIISLIIIGRFGYEELYLSVISFPAMIMGFYLSGKTAKYLDRGFLRPAVLLISTLSAVVVIVKTLL
jgi:uncharacterized membrane protein YfcA